jgi:S-DNA-T family DNA segregation ATPase FtsK/SpoIIIE
MDEDERQLHLVTDAEAVEPGAGERLPSARIRTPKHVLPPWLRSRSTASSELGRLVKYALVAVAHFLVRVPLYLALLSMYAPRGLGRSVVWFFSWYTADPHQEVRIGLASAATANPTSSAMHYLFESERRRARSVRGRTFLVVLAVAAVTVAAIAGGSGGKRALVAAALVVLGILGRNRDKPLLTPMAYQEPNPKPTPAILFDALISLRVKALTDGVRAGEVRFASELIKDGKGWSTTVDLPRGVTWEDVANRRSMLASALRRDVICLFLAKGIHEGQLKLWVGDKRLTLKDMPGWPLATSGQTNIFDELPLAINQRGDLIGVDLMFSSMVIGAVPRMGKTNALRLILTAAAMDPRCRLYLANLKGGPDLSMFDQVAEYCATGSSPAELDALMAMLRERLEDVKTRMATMDRLPRERCPGGQITDELASDPALGLWPIIIAIDECQELFESDYRDEAEKVTADLARMAPAAGVVLIFSTQRPDAKALPGRISTNATFHLCFRVESPRANNMVMGAGSYDKGINAMMFTKADKGLAWYSGGGDDAQVVQTFDLDNVATAAALVRAREIREKAGTLPRVQDSVTPPSILDHLLEVWPGTEDVVWSETLAQLLASTFPSTYPGLTRGELNQELRKHQLSTSHQKGHSGSVRRGPSLVQVQRAADLRSTGLSGPVALVDPR